MSTHVGGGAVNAAVAMARLGMDVAVLAKLGSDERADTILRHLKQRRCLDRVGEARSALADGRRLFSFPHMTEMQHPFVANTLLEVEDLHDEAFAVDVAYIANLSNNSTDCFSNHR